jgi:F5/8 type C domain
LSHFGDPYQFAWSPKVRQPLRRLSLFDKPVNRQSGPIGLVLAFRGILSSEGDQPMRKRIINQGTEGVSAADKNWLDLEDLAQAEVSSEDAGHPIESALISNTGSGWQAAQPGKQTIRLLFDKPQKIRSICLVFQEDEQARTQEFVLSWSSDGGQSYREIARQQYNFSPPSTTREAEDYTVDLNGLTTLELIVLPDISGGPARASVAQLRLA